jgi:hypothetical protein
MPDPAPPPVRFRLGFSSPSSLLAELTRAVNRGQVVLPIGRPVALGTRFLFDLHAPGVSPGVEVLGEVAAVTPRGEGRWELTIRYERGEDRDGLDAALTRLREAHRYEQVRTHPRLPFHLTVQEARADSPHYLIRDISRGGVGVELGAGEALAPSIRAGETVLLELGLRPGVLYLHGEVAWAQGAGSAVGAIRAGFGVRFGKLRPEMASLLEQVLALELMPQASPPPRLSFGAAAVDRMP